MSRARAARELWTVEEAPSAPPAARAVAPPLPRRRRSPTGVDLSEEMGELADRLAQPEPGAGRAVQFVSARSGEGTSTVARAFALAAADRGGRAVWLVELDLMAGAQAQAFAGGAYGELGSAVGAGLDGAAFFEVSGPGGARRGGDPLSVLSVLGRGLWVTRFEREALRPGWSVRLTGGDAFWRALKARADLIVVDAPAAERSRAAAVMAPHMEATVIVVRADGADPSGPALLRDGIEAVGGRCAGVVLNRTPRPAPRFLRSLAP